MVTEAQMSYHLLKISTVSSNQLIIPLNSQICLTLISVKMWVWQTSSLTSNATFHYYTSLQSTDNLNIRIVLPNRNQSTKMWRWSIHSKQLWLVVGNEKLIANSCVKFWCFVDPSTPDLRHMQTLSLTSPSFSHLLFIITAARGLCHLNVNICHFGALT